ncbi:shikimate kinase [Paenibacillus sp. JX-17]|uniref:Shikimate kinase n=1 Tax=Paenibacillus lacisoli TaxID=3064525 RepID=A0ABT9CC78_9BACL|nr:shikimate kinase [Paenibacillus sp. JX-17]MDO7905291.1 shikimate kinase [Paenibacillus sp. JX-17]
MKKSLAKGVSALLQEDTGPNLILVGMMGTGKSTVSRILAQELGYHLIDMDEEIERLEGRSIADIFTQHGEEYFREAEAAALRSICSAKGQVISTGGGSVLRSVNCDLMLSSGLVVALTAVPEVIIERVSGNPDRPLLAGGVEDRVRRIMEERRDAYKFAHVEVDTSHLSAAEVASMILAHYRV